jgi:hypothetical protein
MLSCNPDTCTSKAVLACEYVDAKKKATVSFTAISLEMFRNHKPEQA